MISLKDFFSFKKNRFFWLNLAGMIIVTVAVCWGTLLWLDKYTHHGESYVVPDVTNKTIAEARRALGPKKLEYAVVDSSYVKGSPAGIVLRPKAVGRIPGKRRQDCISDRYNNQRTPLWPCPTLSTTVHSGRQKPS